MAGRPYGLSTYGTGRYGVGAGANFEVAGQTSITLQAFVKPAVVYAGTAAAAGITFSLQASVERIWSPAAAAQIQFSIKGVAYRIAQVAGRTQISFSVQGELVKTWQDPGPCFVPCEPGEWVQEFPPWVVRQAA